MTLTPADCARNLAHTNNALDYLNGRTSRGAYEAAEAILIAPVEFAQPKLPMSVAA